MTNSNFEIILYSGITAAAIILAFKLVWKVLWGIINWLSDLYLSSKYESIYKELNPMWDYIPFWDLFADEKTRERRMVKSFSLRNLKNRIQKGEQ